MVIMVTLTLTLTLTSAAIKREEESTPAGGSARDFTASISPLTSLLLVTFKIRFRVKVKLERSC
jgi:hypothetical protein